MAIHLFHIVSHAKEYEDGEAHSELDPVIKGDRPVRWNQDDVPPGWSVYPTPAVWNKGIAASVLVKNVELDWKAKYDESQRHEEEAQKAGFGEA